MPKPSGFLCFAIIGLLSAAAASAAPHPCWGYGDSLYDAILHHTTGNAWLGCKAAGTTVNPYACAGKSVLLPTNKGTCHVCVPQDYVSAIQSGNWGIFDGHPDLTCLGCIDKEALADNHSAWWTLDERSGTQAADSVGGYAGYGSHFGNPVPVPGKVNYGLQFDGVDDYVQVQDNDMVDFPGNFTIVAWVKAAPADLSGVRPIVEKRQPSPLRGYSFYLYRNPSYHPNGYQLALQLADGSAGAGYRNYGSIASTTTLDGGWHFVAVSVDRGSNATFYIDGMQLGQPVSVTATPLSIANSSVLRIGMTTASSPSRFKGVIDEVMMFDRVLGAAEIQSLFSSGVFGMCRW